MLNPVTFDLTCYVGGTFDEEFIFWDDADATDPHDFTGWTFSMSINIPIVGVVHPTLNVSANSVLASLTSTQTAAYTPGTSGHWILSMSDTSSPPNVEYLMHGTFNIVAP